MANSSNLAIVFHDQNNDLLYDITNICSKVGLNFLNCCKLDIFSYIANSFNPKYVIICSANTPTEFVENFSKLNPNTYIFVYTHCSFSKNLNNIFTTNDLNILCEALRNHYYYYIKQSTSDKEEYLFDQLLHQEFNNLNFSPKIVGTRYFKELILEAYLNFPNLCFKCNNLYDKISKKFNTLPSSIERTIRFSIIKAYQHSKNKQVFYDISKSTKIPTIKEVANYILDNLCFKIKQNPPN